MKFDPEKHHRRSIRVPGYDYALGGGYFVTIVSQGRACLFGEIINGEMVLNDAGRMVQKIWEAIPTRFVGVELGAYVVMPNHFHPIVMINEPVGATLVVAQNVVAQNRAGTSLAPTRPTLGDIIGAFKSITTHEYIQGVKESGWPPFDQKLWQRNYACRVLCGIMSTSFAMMMTTNGYKDTSNQTPASGRRMEKILLYPSRSWRLGAMNAGIISKNLPRQDSRIHSYSKEQAWRVSFQRPSVSLAPAP